MAPNTRKKAGFASEAGGSGAQPSEVVPGPEDNAPKASGSEVQEGEAERVSLRLEVKMDEDKEEAPTGGGERATEGGTCLWK